MNFIGTLTSVATPPDLYSEKADVSPMLKEYGPVEEVRSVTFCNNLRCVPSQPGQTRTQVFDFHGANAVQLRHALELREGNRRVVWKYVPVISRIEHHSRILLPQIHNEGFWFL